MTLIQRNVRLWPAIDFMRRQMRWDGCRRGPRRRRTSRRRSGGSISCSGSHRQVPIHHADFARAANGSEMTDKQFPIDLNAHLRQEPDQTFTILIEISGIPSIARADHINWLRTAIRDNADMLGKLDTPPRQH
jgi:hypothetical protein